jgi:hypothetical protein
LIIALGWLLHHKSLHLETYVKLDWLVRAENKVDVTWRVYCFDGCACWPSLVQ